MAKIAMHRPLDGFALVRQRKRFGRNDLCFCGSGWNTRNATDHRQQVDAIVLAPSTRPPHRRPR